RQVRAHPVRAAVRLRRHAAGGRRLAGLAHLPARDPGDGGRAHRRHGRQPRDRRAHRRPQPAHGGPRDPSGKLTGRDGWLITLAGVALLVVAGALLNRLTLLLLPVALAFLIAYPYLKRFTWACHLWLGVTIGAAAAGGYIAVTGAFAAPAWALWLGVGAWVAGFDGGYGLLDLECDRA